MRSFRRVFAERVFNFQGGMVHLRLNLELLGGGLEPVATSALPDCRSSPILFIVSAWT